MWEQGNATLYACWVDEGLNLVLREICKRAHPLTFDYRVLQSFRLVSMLGLKPFLGEGEEEWDRYVSSLLED